MDSKAKLELQLKAINNLAEYDHCFIGPDGVRELTAPFGFVGSTYLAQDTRNEMKGLTLGDGSKTAEGQDAERVAMQICQRMNVQYARKYGRGSQLRECCNRMKEHLQRQLLMAGDPKHLENGSVNESVNEPVTE